MSKVDVGWLLITVDPKCGALENSLFFESWASWHSE